jgi:hypothetical protein
MKASLRKRKINELIFLDFEINSNFLNREERVKVVKINFITSDAYFKKISQIEWCFSF